MELRYARIIEYYGDIKRSELLIQTITEINLKCNMLSDSTGFIHTVWYHCYDFPDRQNYAERKKIWLPGTEDGRNRSYVEA